MPNDIVRPRAEEIFEMVRDRLADSPFAAEPRARVVLSGGASQLTGLAVDEGRAGALEIDALQAAVDFDLFFC